MAVISLMTTEMTPSLPEQASTHPTHSIIVILTLHPEQTLEKTSVNISAPEQNKNTKLPVNPVNNI